MKSKLILPVLVVMFSLLACKKSDSGYGRVFVIINNGRNYASYIGGPSINMGYVNNLTITKTSGQDYAIQQSDNILAFNDSIDTIGISSNIITGDSSFPVGSYSIANISSLIYYNSNHQATASSPNFYGSATFTVGAGQTVYVRIKQ